LYEVAYLIWLQGGRVRVWILCAYLTTSAIFTLVVFLILTLARSEDRDYMETTLMHEQNGHLREDVFADSVGASGGFPPFF
jgi:hypothetical protein